ncbi:MAG: oligosaccharide flippase family protein [Clostridium sp.]
MIGGTSIAQLVIILASPILARVFTPEDFGSFAILTTVVYILTALSCLRLDVAILSSRSDLELSWLFKKSLTILVTMIMFITLILFAFYYLIGSYLEILIFIPLMVFLSGFFNILNNLTLRLQNTHLNAKSKIMQSGGGALSQLILGFQGLGFKGMVLGQILGFVYSITYLTKKNFLHFKNIFFVSNKSYKIIDYKKYIIYDSIGAVFSVVANHIPTLLISLLLGKSFGGSYYMAYRVLMLPVAVISISISQFIGSKYTEWKSKGVYHKNLSKILYCLSVLVFIPSFLLIDFLPDIFSYVLGGQWVLAGEIAAISIIWIAVKFIFESLVITFSLDNGQKIGLLFQAFLTLVRVSAIFIGWRLGLDSFIIMKIFCIISFLSYFFGLILISFINKINMLLSIKSFAIGVTGYFFIYIASDNFLLKLIFLGIYTLIWAFLSRNMLKIAKDILL